MATVDAVSPIGQQHKDHTVQFGDLRLTIRHILAEEHDLLYKLAMEDGWEVNISEMRILMATYKGCGMGAFAEEGILVCSWTGVTLDSKFTQLDFFLTKEEFRKRGIGSYMLNYFSQLYGDTQLIFDAKIVYTPFYERKGFRKRNKCVMRVEGIPIKRTFDDKPDDVEVMPISSTNIENVLQYDRDICLGDRRNFMRKYLLHGSSYVCIKQAWVQGIISAWKCEEKSHFFRISSFYADSVDVAKVLFNRVVQDIEGENGSVAIYFLDDNEKNVMQLCQSFGLLKVTRSCEQMTNGRGSIDIPTEKVYSTTQTVGHYI